MGSPQTTRGERSERPPQRQTETVAMQPQKLALLAGVLLAALLVSASLVEAGEEKKEEKEKGKKEEKGESKEESSEEKKEEGGEKDKEAKGTATSLFQSPGYSTLISVAVVCLVLSAY